MATKWFKHLTTLSAKSKAALQSGHVMKMISQVNNLQRLFKQSTPDTKGASHRHLIAMKQAVGKCVRRHLKSKDCNMNPKSDANFSQLGHIQDFVTACDNSQEKIEDTKLSSYAHERETLSNRKMKERKRQTLYTRKRAKADDSLKETIYKHYYQKLTRLTSMRAFSVTPPYMDRVKTRSAGFTPEHDIQSYEEKFRDLMYKLKVKWKPRDYIQRKCDFTSLFCRLCTNIMDCIRKCIYAKGQRLESMDTLDNLFRILKRFKISSPVFRKKWINRGGGPKKKMKTDISGFGNFGKKETIGKEQLSVPVVDSLSKVLKGQFKQEHGLLNVSKLHKASKVPGPVTQIMKKFDLRPVPNEKHAVQIHFCRNHYVTSEQKSNGIVVYDSLQTDNDFKVDLYPQLRFTYEVLNQYSTPPKDFIQYETPQQQDDSSSCGIFAVLRAYFILSHKSYTFNPDIGRSYISSTLRKNVFTNFDSFTSNYIIDNFIQDKKQLKANESGKAATSTVISHNPVCMTNRQRDKLVQLNKFETFSSNNSINSYMQDQQRLQAKKVEMSASSAPRTSLNPKAVANRKRGRPVQYSAEEKKQRDKANKLKHYHKSKGNMSSKKLPEKIGDIAKSATEDFNANGKRILPVDNQCPPPKRGRPAIDRKTKTVNKGGRPPKYSPEEKKIKNREKSLKHYHNKKKVLTVGQIQKQRDWHKEHKQSMGLDANYREGRRIKMAQKRKDTVYREEEKAKDKQWHADRRHDVVYREGERVKDVEWHKAMRSNPSKKKEEKLTAHKKKYGKNEGDAIEKYLAAIQNGPNVVCTCCLQLWFPDNCKPLEKLTFPNLEKVNECKTGICFEGKEWLCSTCTRHLKENRIPPISNANGVKFHPVPDELKLVQMEERCIALRQPFFQIRELPSGGQKSIKGNVVNVPMDVTKTINQLPRNLNETETIGIKFKKKVSYKKCDYCENIRPQALIKAARYLIANS